MAHKLDISDIKDFINLTFSCQQATVITDFSDLEQIGKNHALALNNGAMVLAEYGKKSLLPVPCIHQGTG